jgi:hypothetical protein
VDRISSTHVTKAIVTSSRVHVVYLWRHVFRQLQASSYVQFLGFICRHLTRFVVNNIHNVRTWIYSLVVELASQTRYRSWETLILPLHEYILSSPTPTVDSLSPRFILSSARIIIQNPNAQILAADKRRFWWDSNPGTNMPTAYEVQCPCYTQISFVAGTYLGNRIHFHLIHLHSRDLPGHCIGL